MTTKSDPRCLLLSWKLQKGFELVVMETTQKGGRVKSKNMGTVAKMQSTGKGLVGNKRDQLLMFLSTTSQDENAPPYSLQVGLLDYKSLNANILSSVNTGMGVKPSHEQLASNHSPSSVCHH